jgi:hypothetical protein
MNCICFLEFLDFLEKEVLEVLEKIRALMHTNSTSDRFAQSMIFISKYN